MSTLKNAFVAAMMAVGSHATAQHVTTTNDSLYNTISEDSHVVDAHVAADNSTMSVKNTIPTFANPREGSLVHQIQCQGLTEGFYRYRKNAFVQVKFKMEGEKTRIIVKFYQLDADADFGQSLPVDRLVLDGYGHILPRNPHAADAIWQYNSFFVSTPLYFIGSDRPKPEQSTQ